MQIDPQCLDCVHYKGNFKCKAFDRIPIEIFTGWHNHIEPYKGDNGIRFEPINKDLVLDDD